MASTGSGGGGHGGRRNNSGRKKMFNAKGDAKKNWEKGHKRISLETNIYESWFESKNTAGYSGCTDSTFAAHLLSLEYRRRYVSICFINRLKT